MSHKGIPLGWIFAGIMVAVTGAVAIPPLRGEADPAYQPRAVEVSEEWAGTVAIQHLRDNSFRYLVNGKPQVFIGMGYNPIYRYLTDGERSANYDRDFSILCEAGVNHIVGWDSDKGYEQDKFDEITLDYAQKYGIGVIMPFYLEAFGDYTDSAYRQKLLDEAAAKVSRFKEHPALRMWGIGNEVLLDGLPVEQQAAFWDFYLELADLFRALDTDHPVIYRDSEDVFLPQISEAIQDSLQERPWLLYGMNVYTRELDRIVEDWPEYGLGGPLFVTEFGSEPEEYGGRGAGYASMWRKIRSHPGYVMGGAPYVWTTEGPEPTDTKWGLMDGNATPIDDAFELLKAEWLKEVGAARSCAP